MPSGRPKGSYKIEWDEQRLGEIERLAGLGMTLEQIASILGIARSTFFEYRREIPAIADAFEAGKAKAGAEVAAALYRKAIAEDVPAIRWYEMTRQNRSEKTQTEITERRYVLAIPERESVEDWEKRYSGTTKPSGEI